MKQNGVHNGKTLGVYVSLSKLVCWRILSNLCKYNVDAPQPHIRAHSLTFASF